MISTEAVYTLIKSLKSPEKRYFKLWGTLANRNKPPKYLFYFDHFDSSSELKQAQNLTPLSDQGVDTRFFAADRRQLYFKILESLRQFHSGKTISLSLKNHLIEIELLFARGLFQQCHHWITKARKLAAAWEEFALELELLKWERQVAGSLKGLPAAQSVHADEQQILEKLSNLNAFVDLHYQSSMLRIQSSRARDPKFLEEFEQLLHHPLMASPDRALSISAALRYHQVMISYAFVKSDQALEEEHASCVIELLEGEPGFRKEKPFLYLTFFSRLLQLKSETAPDEFSQMLKEFRAFPKDVQFQRKRVELRVFELSYVTQLYASINQKDWKGAREIFTQILAGIEKYGEKIEAGIRMGLWYGMARVDFELGNYQDSLKATNHLLNYFKETDRPDLIHFGRLLLLFLHFELGNYEFMQYRIKAFTGQFKKRKTLFQTEKAVFDFFRSYLSLAERGEKRSLLESFRMELEGIFENPRERHALSYFGFQDWVEGQLGRFSGEN